MLSCLEFFFVVPAAVCSRMICLHRTQDILPPSPEALAAFNEYQRSGSTSFPSSTKPNPDLATSPTVLARSYTISEGQAPCYLGQVPSTPDDSLPHTDAQASNPDSSSNVSKRTTRRVTIKLQRINTDQSLSKLLDMDHKPPSAEYVATLTASPASPSPPIIKHATDKSTVGKDHVVAQGTLHGSEHRSTSQDIGTIGLKTIIEVPDKAKAREKMAGAVSDKRFRFDEIRRLSRMRRSLPQPTSTGEAPSAPGHQSLPLELLPGKSTRSSDELIDSGLSAHHQSHDRVHYLRGCEPERAEKSHHSKNSLV